jgi:hypothetical protein
LAVFVKLSLEWVYFADATRCQYGNFQSASIKYSVKKSAISLNMLSVSSSMSNCNVELCLFRASYPIPESATFVTSTPTIYVGIQIKQRVSRGSPHWRLRVLAGA